IVEPPLKEKTHDAILSAIGIKKMPQKFDLRKNIGLNDKFQFISELFNKNVEQYESMLDEVNTCKNSEEMLRIFYNYTHLHPEQIEDEKLMLVQEFERLVNEALESK